MGRRGREGGGAALFEEYVQRPENQAKVLEFGFRPNNPSVALADPIVAANGVDPDQPTTELEVPEPEVLIGILDAWAELRKDARVLLVLDISGSMGDPGGEGGPSSTWPRRRRRAPSTSSRTPTRSGCGCSAPTSAVPTRTCASSCRSP